MPPNDMAAVKSLLSVVCDDVPKAMVSPTTGNVSQLPARFKFAVEGLVFQFLVDAKTLFTPVNSVITASKTASRFELHFLIWRLRPDFL